MEDDGTAPRSGLRLEQHPLAKVLRRLMPKPAVSDERRKSQVARGADHRRMEAGRQGLKELREIFSSTVENCC